MIIKIQDKIYAVRENKASWTVSITIGRVGVTYNVSKNDCPTFDKLKAYMETSNLF